MMAAGGMSVLEIAPVRKVPWVSISDLASLRLCLWAPGPLIVPLGGCLMPYNETPSIPWWHGGSSDFGVVTS